jgi:lipopolysaccharide transport system permease protein
VLGAAWAIGAPLLTMAVYVFAFTVLFRGRLGPTDNGLKYTAYVLAAMVPWLALQDAVMRATVCVSGSASLVKQIVFPTEVLPLKVVLATIPALLVGLMVTVVLAIAAGATNAFGILVLLPIAVALLLLMCAGLAYILAAVGVFLRDIKDIVNVLLMIGFFLHPIIYPPTQVPRWLGRVFAISPFTHVIGCFRDALVDGAVTRPWSWLISLVTALVLTVIGWRVFRMLRPSFGNAL